MHSLIGAYVLDAVTDAERRRFHDHLTGCQTCAAQLPRLCAVVVALAVACSAEPPADLRDRVMARIAASDH